MPAPVAAGGSATGAAAAVKKLLLVPTLVLEASQESSMSLENWLGFLSPNLMIGEKPLCLDPAHSSMRGDRVLWRR